MTDFLQPFIQSYQFLVRFDNKTHVINLPSHMSRNDTNCNNIGTTRCDKTEASQRTKPLFAHETNMTDQILSLLSKSLKIPSYLLTFSSSSFQTIETIRSNQIQPEILSHKEKTIVKFLTARLHPSFFSILGGKGGFGTLLKSQSKKSGAKTTTDFGACRDLNGRRLRHVNDEIKLRKWRSNLSNTKEEQENVSGWHLNIPGWAKNEAGSEKVRKRNEMKFQRELKKEEEEREMKKRKKEADTLRREQLVLNYADKAQNDFFSNGGGMENAIKQGLKKRMRVEANNIKVTAAKKGELPEQDDDANWLCALAGDMQTTFLPAEFQTKNDKAAQTSISSYPTTYILGKSEFSTACILRPNLHYFEVVLETCGLSQIGFADISSSADFAPNTDTGDGVGDDEFSYAFDVSRSKVFHNYKEYKYPNLQKQKTTVTGDMNIPGNIIGCWYNIAKDEMSFFLNGEDLGVAFSVKEKRKESPGMQMIPALSLNQDEVVGVRVGPYFQYNPCIETSLKPVQDNDEMSEKNHSQNARHSSLLSNNTSRGKTTSLIKNSSPQMAEPMEIKKPSPTIPEHLDLISYDSSESLYVLGLERLKSALLALEVKCGGSLEERAKRLFSLKGLKRSEYPKKVRSKKFTL